jgi:hypothetical protein
MYNQMLLAQITEHNSTCFYLASNKITMEERVGTCLSTILI